jgi:DNA-binding FrmR family transcriptional regulator
VDHASCASKEAASTLKAAKGQVEAAIRMIEEDRYCVDVSKQILASIALLRKANAVVLRQHLLTCVAEAMVEGRGEAKVEEIMRLLESYTG